MSNTSSFLLQERSRIEDEYRRRVRDIESALYAPWKPSEILARTERTGLAARMLHRARVFPVAGDRCLEIGYGTRGWLGDLISWGMRETDLHGIELVPERAQIAQQALPVADLRIGDACQLPWETGYFRVVIASTVFTSVLDSRVRRLIADEITRVLATGGALLWYDFAVNNPHNPHVRKVTRRELQSLFPQLHGQARSVTLAPPIARWIANRSWRLATWASAMPFLRTHLMAVLTKSLSQELCPSPDRDTGF